MIQYKRISILIILIFYLGVIPLVFRQDSYVLHVFIIASEVAVVAMSVRLMNTAGELSFGQVAFVMLGAYFSALIVMKLELSFWISLPLAGFLTFLVALVIGYPILRLKGTYFAILTLIIAEVMTQGARVWKFIGGDEGLLNIPRPQVIAIGDFTIIPEFTGYDKLPYYFLGAFILILTIIVFWRIEQTPLGSIFKALKQNELLAESVGIDVRWYRIFVFGISALFSGLVGGFYAHYMTVFYPKSFSVWDSINYVLYAFIGGIGYLFGPIIGSFGMVWLWEFLGPIQKYQSIIFAIVIIFVILFLPDGVMSVEIFQSRIKRFLFHQRKEQSVIDIKETNGEM